MGVDQVEYVFTEPVRRMSLKCAETVGGRGRERESVLKDRRNYIQRLLKDD